MKSIKKTKELKPGDLITWVIAYPYSSREETNQKILMVLEVKYEEPGGKQSRLLHRGEDEYLEEEILMAVLCENQLMWFGISPDLNWNVHC